MYAEPEHGYGIGYTQNATDENGLPGTYSITGVTEGFDVSLTGQVYITSYVDNESGNTYTPEFNAAALGLSYLGSEHGFIIQIEVPAYEFGQYRQHLL